MDTKQLLRNMLPSLEAAKAALESQILLIRQYLSMEETAASASDPTILGVDSIGRIIRKRTLSPEILEKKRKLMQEIRERRLREIRELREFKARQQMEAARRASKDKRK